MKILSRYSVPVFVFVFFLGASWALAQTGSAVSRIAQVETLGSADWQKTLDDSKKEIQQLLRENERLTSEYDFLRERLSTIQANVLESKQAVEEHRRANDALSRFQKEQSGIREKIRRDMEALKKELADFDNQKASLLKQLGEEEKKTELWQNKLSDLQVKKREHTLELKLQEISRQELEQGQDEEIERLKEELKKHQEREKVLEARLRALQGEPKKLMADVDTVLVSNKALEAKIAQMKTQHDQQKRANDELVKKNEDLRKNMDSIPASLVKERASLDADIQKLETELAAIRKSVESSSELMQKKRQLMNEIMRMDSENQELRRKIDELLPRAQE